MLMEHIGNGIFLYIVIVAYVKVKWHDLNQNWRALRPHRWATRYHIVKSTMDTHRYYNRKIRASTPARNESSCATGEDRLSHPSHKNIRSGRCAKSRLRLKKNFNPSGDAASMIRNLFDTFRAIPERQPRVGIGPNYQISLPHKTVIWGTLLWSRFFSINF